VAQVSAQRTGANLGHQKVTASQDDILLGVHRWHRLPATELVPRIPFGVEGNDPQGLKPASFADLGGTAEAVPFPKPFLKPVLL